MEGQTENMILIEGNRRRDRLHDGGVTFVGWYPITPSSSLCESLIDYLKSTQGSGGGRRPTR